MKIRKLKEDELPPMDLLLLADPSRDMVETYLADGECRVAEIEGEIIGVYVLVKLNGETMEIKNIAVDERMHSRGIGRVLINDAIRTAKELGYKSIEIGTGNSSIGQLALYQKCGFRIQRVIKDFYVHNYDEKIIEHGIQCRDMIRLSIEIG